MRAALAGTPNCGKTTLFNAMTGANYRVANRPGVTVESREGVCRAGDTPFTVIDLPGLYSLTPYSEEESVAASSLTDGHPDRVICVVDALSPGKGISLLREIARQGIPTAVAWARTDLAASRGIAPDFAGLSRLLALPVTGVSGVSGDGLSDLANAVLRGAKIPDPALLEEIPAEKIEKLAGLASDKGKIRTNRADRLLLHPIFGLPCLLTVLTLLLISTFWLGGQISALAESAAGALTGALRTLFDRIGIWAPLAALILDAILPAALSVLTFLPDLILLYLGLGILEDSGYLSRASCVCDRLLARRGLPGKAAIPLLLGLGCTVPAVMSARTLDGRADRDRAIERIPFLPCSAKLPVFLLLSRTFFGRWAWIAPIFLYALGIAAALTGMPGRATEPEYPLLCELPDYQFPHPKTVLLFAADRVRDCLRRVTTVIFLSSILLWFLTYHNLSGACLPKESFLAGAGRLIAPLLAPCGLSDWRIAPAILSGIWGKELIISTLAVLCGPDGLTAVGWTWASGLSMLVFVLFSPPCVAAMAAIRRERGSVRPALTQFGKQLALAWIASALTYQTASLAMRLM